MMAAQISILGNSLEYEERAAKRLMEDMGLMDDKPIKRRQVSPEMLREIMGIEIEYVGAPSA